MPWAAAPQRVVNLPTEGSDEKTLLPLPCRLRMVLFSVCIAVPVILMLIRIGRSHPNHP